MLQEDYVPIVCDCDGDNCSCEAYEQESIEALATQPIHCDTIVSNTHILLLLKNNKFPSFLQKCEETMNTEKYKLFIDTCLELSIINVRLDYLNILLQKGAEISENLLTEQELKYTIFLYDLSILKALPNTQKHLLISKLSKIMWKGFGFFVQNENVWKILVKNLHFILNLIVHNAEEPEYISVIICKFINQFCLFPVSDFEIETFRTLIKKYKITSIHHLTDDEIQTLCSGNYTNFLSVELDGTIVDIEKCDKNADIFIKKCISLVNKKTTTL